MKSRIITVALTALLIMSVVGCPNDTQTGSSTSANNKITSLQTVIDKASDGDTINLSKYTDITDYNATINKAVTINGSQTSLNGAILTVEKNATISSITNASVIVSSELGNGTLKIASSSLSSLTINGGGINSIKVPDCTIDTVTIAKQLTAQSNEFIRLCINTKTSIKDLTLKSSALIDVDGNGQPNVDSMNITFDSTSDTDINVAFRKTIQKAVPTNMVKAEFESGDGDNKDFFIIVNKNKRIDENFFGQVAAKVCEREFDTYKEGEFDVYDFTKPISEDIHLKDSGVSESQVVLYNNNLGNFDMFMDTQSLVSNSDTNSFCFDGEGHVYILKTVEYGESSPVASSTIWSNKNDFGVRGELKVTDAAFESIAYDLTNKQLYGKGGNYIYAINIEGADVTTEQYYLDGFESRSTCFAVHNKKVYIYMDAIPEGTKLLIADLEESSDSVDGGSEKLLSTDVSVDINVNDINGTVTDILYQDGCIYMLMRELSGEWNECNDYKLYSRGVVIKYDCSTGKVMTLGLSNNTINKSDIGTMSLYNGNEKLRDLTADTSIDLKPESQYKKWGELFPTSINAPSSENGTLNQDYFYGPTKFVGIKPKKLVIADDGFAFYTDNDALVFKNVNRIVTVDLENFSMTADDVDNVFDVDLDLVCGEGLGSSDYAKSFNNCLFLGLAIPKK